MSRRSHSRTCTRSLSTGRSPRVFSAFGVLPGSMFTLPLPTDWTRHVQVMLMKSTVPPHVTTWQQFVDYNFTAKLTSLHGAYKNVILSFDNYECVPVT